MSSPRQDIGKKRSVPFPAGSLARAQDERGLKNEQVAAELRISGSTWARWKREDEVPIRDADSVALLLGLPAPEEEDAPPIAWAITEKIEQLQTRVLRIEKELRLQASRDDAQSD